MKYIVIYVIGVAITIFISEYVTRDKPDEKTGYLAVVGIIWPLFWGYVLFVALPITIAKYMKNKK